MMHHYLPISISNRTTATIQVHYEAPSSSLSGYTDSIGAFQITPTKAIKTHFKLQNLQSVVSIDLEAPGLVKIQLVKKTRRVDRPQNHSSSASSATTAHATLDASKTDGTLPTRPAALKSHIKKTLLHKTALNKKFCRLNIDYYLNSQPLKIRDQDLIEEQAEADASLADQPTDASASPGQEPDHQGLREMSDDTTVDSPHHAHGNRPGRRGSHVVQPPPKQLSIPKFEIFQSISDDGSVSIMVLESRNFNNWMSHLPDEVAISELTLPGSHQSCSVYGWPVGQCQTRSLARQLKDGIRFLDIRLALPTKATSTKKQKPKDKADDAGRLVAYHGIQSQVIKFQEILQILDDFLTAQPSETIIISIKRENHSDAELFKKALRNEMVEFYRSEETFKSHWWLNAFLPNSLKQARGKLILFSRKLFQSDDEEDFGIRFPVWPNNSSEIWETSIPNTNVAVQDWYDIGSCLSISKKSTLACVSLCGALHEPLRSTSSPTPLTRQTNPDASTSSNAGEGELAGDGILTACSHQESVVPNSPPRTWVITFLSATSLFLGFPTICSRGIGLPTLGLALEGINSRVARWLVSRRDHCHHPGPNVNATSSSGIKGVVCLMDFYQSPKEALISLLVDCNFAS